MPLRIRLRPGKEKAIREGHPWVFSGAVARAEGDHGASLAEVFDAHGDSLGWGFYSPKSRIRVRMLGHRLGDGPVDRDFFVERLRRALALREAVLPAETDGYRLLNAEGDGLPGWTIDRWGDIVVSQITVAGLEGLRETAYEALRELLPEVSIFQLNSLRARKDEGLSRDDEIFHGEPPDHAPFRESGLHFEAEIRGGQKTGFYCDQRPNRRRVETLAPGRTVLDLFAHSGAFSLYALRGDARRVTAIESAERMEDLFLRHLDLNPDLARRRDDVEWIRADVFDDLRRREDVYDLVICDPPPLIRQRKHAERGARAYKDLNRLAFSRVAPGGFLLSFSCSGGMDPKLFRQVLFSASVEAGRDVALISPLGPGEDHPVALAHLQGEYLKGWLMKVR